MFVLRKENLAKDLNEALAYHKLSPRKAAKSIGISHSTIYRIQDEKEITMGTFMKLLNWLNKNPLYYIKYEPKK